MLTAKQIEKAKCWMDKRDEGEGAIFVSRPSWADMIRRWKSASGNGVPLRHDRRIRLDGELSRYTFARDAFYSFSRDMQKYLTMSMIRAEEVGRATLAEPLGVMDPAIPRWLATGARKDNGGKLSRDVSRWLSDAMDMKHKDYTLRCTLESAMNLASLYDKHVESLIDPRIVITREPHAFLRLGHTRADSGACTSCDGSEAAQNPYIYLQSPGAFVAYLTAHDASSDKRYVAYRTCGVYQDGSLLLINSYSCRCLDKYVMTLIVDGYLASYFNVPSRPHRGGLSYSICSIGGECVYKDSDGRAFSHEDRPYFELNSTGIYREERCTCDSCGDHVYDDDILMVGDYCVCQNCLDNYFCYIDRHDEYHCCEDCLETISGDMELERECIRLCCGEYAHEGEPGLVKIHTGEYALVDD